MKQPIQLTSEIGRLNAVIIHTPGQEVENMTPENTEKALYSDILNLPISQKEHAHFEAVLSKVSKVYQLKTLLTETLSIEKVKLELINQIYHSSELNFIIPDKQIK